MCALVVVCLETNCVFFRGRGTCTVACILVSTSNERVEWGAIPAEREKSAYDCSVRPLTTKRKELAMRRGKREGGSGKKRKRNRPPRAAREDVTFTVEGRRHGKDRPPGHQAESSKRKKKWGAGATQILPSATQLIITGYSSVRRATQSIRIEKSQKEKRESEHKTCRLRVLSLLEAQRSPEHHATVACAFFCPLCLLCPCRLVETLSVLASGDPLLLPL